MAPLTATSGLSPIRCTASPRVTDCIASLARTEDVRFSPSNRRLAIAAFHRARVLVLDVRVGPSPASPSVSLDGGVELLSPALRLPHGVDFLDDDTLIVTNRAGDVVILPIPPGTADVAVVTVEPREVWPAAGSRLLRVPGSVRVVPAGNGDLDAFICNNDGHTISRHRLTGRGGAATLAHEDALLDRFLDVPDGVAASDDGRWLAVSNHGTHSVLVYERSAALGAESEPAAMLRRVCFPHGLSFTPDGRYLIVADAGAPRLHVFARPAESWHGVMRPAGSVRVMDDATFQRGHGNLAEGGPKGLDVDRGGRVVALTCEHAPLTFFEVTGVIASANHEVDVAAVDREYELAVMTQQCQMHAELQEAQATIDYLWNSLSWRLTRPVRLLHDAVRALTGAIRPGA